jgi:hypothetical protein
MVNLARPGSDAPLAAGPLVVIASLLLAAFAAGITSVGIADDRAVPVAADLTPGRIIPAPTYAAPDGCPARGWSVGEYLPRACMTGYDLTAGSAALGLEAPSDAPGCAVIGTRGRMCLRHRHWVRVGPDAAFVAAPSGAAGKILAVARGRFEGERPEAVAGDWRAMPADYRAAMTRSFLIMPLLCLGLAAALAAPGVARRRRT